MALVAGQQAGTAGVSVSVVQPADLPVAPTAGNYWLLRLRGVAFTLSNPNGWSVGLIHNNANGSAALAILYRLVPSGATVTPPSVTLTTAQVVSSEVEEHTGLAATGVLDRTVSAETSGTGTTLSTGTTAATTQADETALALLGANASTGATTFTATNSFSTAVQNTGQNDARQYNSARTLTTTTTVETTFSNAAATARRLVAGVATFRAAAMTLTPVGEAVVATWDIKGPSGETVGVLWGVNATVGQSVSLVADVRNTVGETVSTLWSVAGATGETVTVTWDVPSTVGETGTVTWDVLTTVGETSTVQWSVTEAAGDSVEALWDTSQLAGRETVASWDVAATTGATHAILWDVRGELGGESEIVWGVLSTVGGSVTGRWDIVDRWPVGTTVVVRWDTYQSGAPWGVATDSLFNRRDTSTVRPGTTRETVRNANAHQDTSLRGGWRSTVRPGTTRETVRNARHDVSLRGGWRSTVRPPHIYVTLIDFIEEDLTMPLEIVEVGAVTQGEIPEALLIRFLRPSRTGGPQNGTNVPVELYGRTPAYVATVHVAPFGGSSLSRAATILDPAALASDYPDDFSGPEEGWVRVDFTDGDFDTFGNAQVQVVIDNGVVRLKSRDVWSYEVADGPAAAVSA